MNETSYAADRVSAQQVGGFRRGFRSRSSWAAPLLILAGAVSSQTVSAQTTPCGLPAGTTIFGLTGDNRLLEYNPIPASSTGQYRPRVVGSFISSLTFPSVNVPSSDTLVGIDFRPANADDSLLYAVTDKGDVRTLAAFPGTLNTSLPTNLLSTLNIAYQGGIQSLVDFNPVVDAIRLIGSNEQNFAVVNANGGNLNQGVTQTTLRYATGDLAAGLDPNITGGAYDNNFAGATSTTFYMLDYAQDTLVTIADRTATGSSNTGGGMLKTIGKLVDATGQPLNVSPAAALDIVTTSDRRNIAVGYSTQKLFCLDLSAVNANLPVGTTQPVTIFPVMPQTNNTATNGFFAIPENLVGLAVPTRAPTTTNVSVTLVRSDGGSSQPRLGEVLTFTAIVKNNGPSIATGLVLTFTSNQSNGVGLDVQSVTGPFVCSPQLQSRATALCLTPSLTSGKSVTATLTVTTVRPPTNSGPNNQTLTTRASITGLVPDTNANDNAATVTVPVTI